MKNIMVISAMVLCAFIVLNRIVKCFGIEHWCIAVIGVALFIFYEKKKFR